MRAIPTTFLGAIAWLSLCATAIPAQQPASPAASSQATAKPDATYTARMTAKAAQVRAAAGSKVSSTAPAPAPAQSVAADAATVQRVHAWEAQREAAAQAAIQAADRRMEKAMRSGEAPADPVLWTTRAVFPKDAVEPEAAVVAANPAGNKGNAAGLTSDAAANRQSGEAPGHANAGAASGGAVTRGRTASTAAPLPSLTVAASRQGAGLP